MDQSYSSPVKERQLSEYYTYASYMDEDKVSQAESDLNTLVLNEDWKELQRWGEKIVKENKKALETIKVQFGLEPNQYLQHIKTLKGVIISRIAFFAGFKKEDEKKWSQVLWFYNQGVQSLDEQQKTLYYFLPQLLNASRCLLQSEESASRSRTYTRNNVHRGGNCNSGLRQFDQLIIYFKQLLRTGLFKSSILAIQAIYKEKLKNLTIQSAIQTLETMKIDFVDGCDYNGMVSFQGIFINEKFLMDIELLQIQAELINLLFHEGIHVILRKINNNIFEMTPPNQFKDDVDLEGGFLFQKIMFGDFKKKYWEHPKKILDENYWNQEPPLFNDQELKEMNNLELDNWQCSGIFPREKKFYGFL